MDAADTMRSMQTLVKGANVVTAAEASYEQSVSAVHNRLFFRLFQAGNSLDRQSAKELGITPVEWSVLGALSRPQVADGMSFSDVVDYLFVSRQSLDGVLKRLERTGYVVRRPDTTDRRVKKVFLTPEGRAAWDALQPKIYEFYRQTLEGFRFDDKVSLVHFLNRLNEGMRSVRLAGNGSPASVSAAVKAPESKKPSKVSKASKERVRA